jgi:molybdate/tungstate transport system permease protein
MSAEPSAPESNTASVLHGGSSWFSLTLVLLGSLVVLLVVAPLLGLVLTGSAVDLRQAIGDPEVIGSIQLTLAAAGLAAVGCSVGGIPLAYLLARRRFPGRSLLLAVIDLPIVIPHSAAGIALLAVIGRRSALGSCLERLGIGLVGEIGGIALAMAFVSLPFLVNAARQGFSAVPPRLENAARTLGASPARVFFTISLPMSWRAIVAGLVLMWGRGISEFGAVIIIAYHPMVTPVLVYQRFNDYGLDSAQAVALLLVLICVALFALLRWLARSPEDDRNA